MAAKEPAENGGAESGSAKAVRCKRCGRQRESVAKCKECSVFASAKIAIL